MVVAAPRLRTFPATIVMCLSLCIAAPDINCAAATLHSAGSIERRFTSMTQEKPANPIFEIKLAYAIEMDSGEKKVLFVREGSYCHFFDPIK